MADRLIFPLGFDIETARQETERELGDMLKRMNDILRKEPIKVHMALDNGDKQTVFDFFKDASSIKGINNELKKLRDTWNKMEFEKKFDADGKMTAAAEDLVQKFTQLTEASKRYGLTLEEATRQAIKTIDDEVKAQEKALAATQRRQQQDIDLARKREEVESNVAAKIREARSSAYDKQNLTVVEQNINAYNRQVEAVDRLKAKLEQIKRIEASGSSRLTLKDGTNSELKNRIIQRSIELTNKLGRETEKMYAAETRMSQSIAKKRQEVAALQLQENTLDNINKKLAAYSALLRRTEIGSTEFDRINKEVERLSKSLDQLSGKSVKVRDLDKNTREFREQTTYVERLIKRMAVYASVGAIAGFASKVREITAQFELQRVSLGAIINDQARANQLFSEIKQFALKSPITIMDLTKYTKQVAAYRIETDKLFDTTKRLADVSVGLGVDMGRIVLAYGQVKAASYLRAAEIRQFTEAGIPLLELLAEKFTQLNGEAVTTEKVMDMVSKRMVGFEMVEQIFNDMTSAGGMFYNMQEKQGNTLFGMWAKLGDAASIMYDEIGNTSYVNAAMKSTIQMLTDMMRNWRSLAREIGIAVAAFTIYKLFLQKVAIEQSRQAAATTAATLAQRKHNLALRLGGGYLQFTTKMAAAAAAANAKAAAATNLFSASMYKLKAAFLGNWMTAVLVGLAVIIERLYTAYENAHRLEKALDDIKLENIVEQEKSVRNFEALAEAAVSAVDGSKKQRDALDELQRTYKDIIPVEQLSIENLRKMNHEYGELTKSIRQYIQEQMKRKAADEIRSQTETKILEAQKAVSERLSEGIGWSKGNRAVPALKDTEIARFWEEYRRLVESGLRDIDELVAKSFKAATGKEATKTQIFLLSGLQSFWEGVYKMGGNDTYLEKLTKSLGEQNDKIKESSRLFSDAGTELGHYQDKVEALDKTLSSATFAYVNKKGENVGAVDESSFLGQQMKINLAIKQMGMDIQQAFVELGLTWDNSMANFIEHVDTKNPEIVSALDFGKIIAVVKASGNSQLQKYVETLQKRYNEMIPQDVVVQTVRKRLQDIVKAAGLTYDNFVKYQMGASETLEEYRKNLKGNIDALKNEVKEYLYALQKVLAGEAIYAGQLGWGMTDAQIKAKVQELQANASALEQLYKDMPSFDKPKKTSGGGRTEDPRLNALKEEISLTKKLYDEYNKLEKQIGASKAAAKIKEIYANTIKTLQDKASKYGFELELPFSDKSLKADMQNFINEMKKLQKLTNKKGKPLFPNIGKEIDEAVAQMEGVDLDSLQKKLEQKIKDLADRVAKTKTAKEFYDKILAQTGDVDIATSISVSIYGDTGEGLFDDMAAQIRQAFESENYQVGIEVEAAIDETNQVIDYQKLASIYEKYQSDLIEANRKTAQELIKNGQKTASENILTWEKELAKAKDYEQKRTDIINRESERRKNIIKATTKENADEMARLLSLSYEKQAQELAKLSVDEFKNSDDYIKVFQDLDAVSGATLDRMQQRLEKMIETVKETENVEGLKTLIDSLEKIKAERIERNPIEGIIQSFKNYRAARKALHEAEVNEANVRAAYETERIGLENAVTSAKSRQALAQQRIDELTEQGLQGTKEYKLAQMEVEDAAKGVAKAVKAQEEAQDKVADAAKETTDAADASKKAVKDFKDSLQAASQTLDSAADSVQKIADLLGVAEDTELGDIVNGLISGFQTVASILTTVLTIMIAIESAAWPLLAVGAAVGGIVAAFNVISNAKVRKAEKEIKSLERAIDSLERSLKRLEKEMEKAFGGDYIMDYNTQLKLLQQKAKAYLAQARAERSKGKKADEDKIAEYENSYRDTMDEISDLQSQLATRFLGTDLAAAARDFASAWLDAYKEFGSTTDAIKEKFEDMVQNMLVESGLGKVMEAALKPVYNLIDDMESSDFNDPSFWNNVFSQMDAAVENANVGATNWIKWIEQSTGKSFRAATSGLTGISRDIASASEESINGLAAGINTQNFYISQIYASVAGIYTLMQSQNGNIVAMQPNGEGLMMTDLITMQNQHLSQLPNIAQNTADAAARLETIVTMLNRVIRTKGQTTQFAVSTTN